MLSDLWKKSAHIIAAKCKYDCLHKPNINTQRVTVLETGHLFTVSFLPADTHHIRNASPSLLILKTCLFSFIDPCFNRCLIGVLTWNGSNKHWGKGSSSTDMAHTHTQLSHTCQMSDYTGYRGWHLCLQCGLPPGKALQQEGYHSKPNHIHSLDC